MKTLTKLVASPRLVLSAETAEEFMTPNPISIRATMTLKETCAFLVDKGFSAAPVVDDAGRPVGVLSQTDIVVHERNKVEHVPPVPEYYRKADLTAPSGEPLPGGFQVEKVDRTLVRDLMTPVVLSVAPTDSATQVIAHMLAFKVHRLFVVDEAGVLVGLISAFDVLRNLRQEGSDKNNDRTDNDPSY